MAKNLVIVESPAKAKTITKILGADFRVMASVGHIRDLPEKEKGIIYENGEYKLKYEVSSSKTRVVNDLKKAVKEADKIYLAPDPDREGEAIAWHLHEVLKASGKGKDFLRIQYNEITPRAVKYAVEHPGEINQNRVDAQQARRVIDRLVGFDISKRLWRRINGAKSAGRVQTVALRLVCEREEKVTAFTPEAYWVLGANLGKETATSPQFFARLSHINNDKAEIKTEEVANQILQDLKQSTIKTKDIRTRELTRRPLPPFITSSLQQAASSFLHISPSRTMSLAQSLYEGIDLGNGTPVGLITYMRTDAPTISQDAQAAAKSYIATNYGTQYIPDKPNIYKSRGNAQEAHEAIRPTDVTRTPESLKNILDTQSLKLYQLIWRRFVASQMAAARLSQRTIDFEARTNQNSYTFTACTTDITFDGFLRVTKLDLNKLAKDAPQTEDYEEEDDNVDSLPDFKLNETAKCFDFPCERKETKPPRRYSEASLVRALEENGVGRPSTYASIIETLHRRDYVKSEKRILTPTDLGKNTEQYLTTRFPELFEVGFTAKMESDLDKIEEGSEKWQKFVGTFDTSLTEWLKEPSANTNTLDKLFQEFLSIKTWATPTKAGKRTIDDKKFYNSIREQYESGEKPITETQATSLAKLLLRYSDQLPGIADRLKEQGFNELTEKKAPSPTPPDTIEKINLLLTLSLSESQQKFVASIKSQNDSGHYLSQAQIGAIDRIVMRLAPKIENASEILSKWGMEISENALEEDTESPELIAKLAKIKTWDEPVKRGKRVFDDKEFADSVTQQFKRNGTLSPRQRSAIKKLLFHYKEQIGEE